MLQISRLYAVTKGAKMINLTNVINAQLTAEIQGLSINGTIENAGLESLKQAEAHQREELLEVLQLERPTIIPPVF